MLVCNLFFEIVLTGESRCLIPSAMADACALCVPLTASIWDYLTASVTIFIQS